MHRNPEYVRYHPKSGVPLMAHSNQVAIHHPKFLQMRYELLQENLKRCRAQRNTPRERYRTHRGQQGHVRIR